MLAADDVRGGLAERTPHSGEERQLLLAPHGRREVDVITPDGGTDDLS